MLDCSPKQHKMVIVTDESKLHEAELKAETCGMFCEYKEEDYDSGITDLVYCNNIMMSCMHGGLYTDPNVSDSSDEEQISGVQSGQILRMTARVMCNYHDKNEG